MEKLMNPIDEEIIDPFEGLPEEPLDEPAEEKRFRISHRKFPNPIYAFQDAKTHQEKEWELESLKKWFRFRDIWQDYIESDNPIFILRAFVYAYDNKFDEFDEMIDYIAAAFKGYINSPKEKSLDDFFGLRKRLRLFKDMNRHERDYELCLEMVKLKEWFGLIIFQASQVVAEMYKNKKWGNGQYSVGSPTRKSLEKVYNYKYRKIFMPSKDGLSGVFFKRNPTQKDRKDYLKAIPKGFLSFFNKRFFEEIREPGSHWSQIESLFNPKTVKGKKEVLEGVRCLVDEFDKKGWVEAKLHKISVSGPYTYEQLVEALGPIHQGLIDPPHMPGYHQEYYRQMHYGFKLAIFLVPVTRRRPRCFIHILPPNSATPSKYKKILTLINDAPPSLKRSVEYTLDICHLDPQFLRALYAALKMFIWVPRSSITESKSIKGRKARRKAKIWINGETQDETLTTAGFRIYERESGGNLRIRLERSVVRRDGLSKKGPNKLIDLLKSAHFYKWNGGKYKFGYFVGRHFPKYFQPFQTDWFHCDRELLREAGKKVITTTFLPLEPIRVKLEESMKEFDRQWKTI